MGAETSREAQEVFWRMSTFNFVDGGHYLRYLERDEPVLSIDRLGLFLDSDIRGLGATPRKHVRNISFHVQWKRLLG